MKEKCLFFESRKKNNEKITNFCKNTDKKCPKTPKFWLFFEKNNQNQQKRQF